MNCGEVRRGAIRHSLLVVQENEPGPMITNMVEIVGKRLPRAW